jgi:hypothetical protein
MTNQELIVLTALAVTFAATCVWLTVRIVNRRERWAKRTAVAITVATILYMLSTGPAAWIWVHAVPDSLSPRYRAVMETVYSPLGLLFRHSNIIQRMAFAYQDLWVSQDEALARLKKDHDLQQ